jgi:hypothetical protein
VSVTAIARRLGSPATMSSLGIDFARALAAKDYDKIEALLDPHIDFRGMTPGRFWEARDPRSVVRDVLMKWFEEQDEIEELKQTDTGSVVDRERVSWRFGVKCPDGRYETEQQAYYETDGNRITFMRVLCSGFRKLEG